MILSRLRWFLTEVMIYVQEKRKLRNNSNNLFNF